MFVCDRVPVFICLVRVHHSDKEEVAERRLEREPNPNGGRTETEDASSRSNSAGEKGCLSVMGTFASPHIPVTLAPHSNRCRLLFPWWRRHPSQPCNLPNLAENMAALSQEFLETKTQPHACHVYVKTNQS